MSDNPVQVIVAAFNSPDAAGQLIREVIKADIAEQLNAGGNVVYTAGDSSLGSAAARVATQGDEVQVNSIVMDDDGIFIDEAVIIAQPVEESDTGENPALDAAQ